MKVLMLTPYLPYPLFSGGQIRSYNLIKNLSPDHKITLLSFVRSDEERQFLPELLKYCQKVSVKKRRRAWSFFNIILSGISYYPFLMSLYWDPGFAKMIKEELKDGSYDFVHVETFYLMHNLPPVSLPIVLAEQNIEWQVYKKFTDRVVPFLKPFLYFDVAKIKIWEEFFWQKAKKIVVASTIDKQVIEAKIKNGVSLVPNGVDLDYFKDFTPKPHNLPAVLFVGNFKWLQNRDAVYFLVNEIWPRIKKEIPKVELLVVGRGAPQKLKQAIVGSGAILREDVVEIAEVYQKVDLLLAPIRIGGGTKFKILEAMAAGIPVVTTKEGIEGLAVEDGQEVLVGWQASDLAKKTVAVFKNEDLRNNLVKKARTLVSQNYNWQTIAKELEKVWQGAVK